jgi:hypothetical protein
VERHVLEFDVALDLRRQLSDRRLGLGLHQLRQQLQRQHRSLVFLHQRRGVDQRLRRRNPSMLKATSAPTVIWSFSTNSAPAAPMPTLMPRSRLPITLRARADVWSSDSVLVAASSL